MSNAVSTIQSDTPVKQATNQPVRKVAVGAFVSALTTVFIFILNVYILPENEPVTPEVAGALTTMIAFLAAYLVPPSPRDQVVPKDNSQ